MQASVERTGRYDSLSLDGLAQDKQAGTAMRELLTELVRALDEGRPCVFCSVVETRGSTPQKAGAAMLVFADGRQAGTLGGGCVEAEVKRNALQTLAGAADARPEVFTFNLDDNYGWDDGLICGGRMSILAAPVPSSAGHREAGRYYRRLHSIAASGTGATEAVIAAAEPLGVPVGHRYLFDAHGRLIDQLGDGHVPGIVAQQLIPLDQRPRAWQRSGVAYVPLLPRITLLIVGGGHVGQAVAHLAADVDFDIWVVDDRAAYASRERFPSAQRVIVGDIGAELQRLLPEVGPSTYALIITRGHAHDEEALYHLARSDAGYVGMIGSKRKIKLIYEDLMARDIASSLLDRVHAPLGFAIGSQTVPEIAVSIVAELIACRNLGHRRSSSESRRPTLPGPCDVSRG
jgi:xanthine dehydrogenase accessory factor